jgi:hypothetical protein
LVEKVAGGVPVFEALALAGHRPGGRRVDAAAAAGGTP